MQTIYPYKYEFASSEDITDSSKYADKKLYRWALMYSSNYRGGGMHYSGTTGGGMAYGSSVGVNSSDFHIYDRQLNKEYQPTGSSNSFIMNVMKPTVATLVKYMKDRKSPPAKD